jgi:hypothetical protein
MHYRHLLITHLKVAPVRLHLHERSCVTFNGFIYKGFALLSGTRPAR